MLTKITETNSVAEMKQIRLSNKNEKEVARLIKDAKLNLLTISRAANLAIEKGLPRLRELFVRLRRR